MNRRDFLKGLVAIGAYLALPSIPGLDKPILHGDGVHNDIEAINALLRGETVYRPDGSKIKQVDGRIVLPVGTYRVSKTIEVCRDNTSILSSQFYSTATPMIREPFPTFNSEVRNCYFNRFNA